MLVLGTWCWMDLAARTATPLSDGSYAVMDDSQEDCHSLARMPSPLLVARSPRLPPRRVLTLIQVKVHVHRLSTCFICPTFISHWTTNAILSSLHGNYKLNCNQQSHFTPHNAHSPCQSSELSSSFFLSYYEHSNC